ncbi:band 7 protein [Pyrolobus fumarii 1A]|uniref:Band 7 protein n=2 Tax=Pyrolobus fumarii TaxID=54252 RepID=G0ECL2_PYRF1|nr:band 7 protein [Pyrolobus fumarii 1A]
MEFIVPLVIVAMLAGLFLAMSIRIVKEYERAVVFRLGRLVGVKGPGLFFIIPFIDTIRVVDLRIHVVDVPSQEIITKDNVTVEVDAVVYYRVFDPIKAVTAVSNYHYAVMMYAQTTLRDIIGQVELDELLTKREEINKRLQRILDEVTDPWGIKVTAVTLKQVKLPESLLRAMALQAEAERLRRARVIEAEGERQAAQIMAEAARIYEDHPIALRLRELQTLIQIAREKNMIVVVPFGALSTAIDIGVVSGIARAVRVTESGRQEHETG